MNKWPFKTCTTPDEFLVAFQQTLPYRFKKWETTWWITEENQLIVHLTYEGRPAAKNRTDLSFGDLIQEDSWHREDAKSGAIRKFKGFSQITMGTGNYDSSCFRVELKYLPKVKAGITMTRKLAMEVEECLRTDDELLRISQESNRLHRELALRRLAVEKMHHEKNKTRYAKSQPMQSKS